MTKRLQDYVILQCVEIMESENALALDYFKENQISFEWIVDEGGAVIRFAPIDIDKQQYASVHGENTLTHRNWTSTHVIRKHSF